MVHTWQVGDLSFICYVFLHHSFFFSFFLFFAYNVLVEGTSLINIPTVKLQSSGLWKLHSLLPGSSNKSPKGILEGYGEENSYCFHLPAIPNGHSTHSRLSTLAVGSRLELFPPSQITFNTSLHMY
jgi:hypothetical protein